jgi:hypothetical protein
MEFQPKPTKPDEDQTIRFYLRRARAYLGIAAKAQFNRERTEAMGSYRADIELIRKRAKEFGVEPTDKDIQNWMERA